MTYGNISALKKVVSILKNCEDRKSFPCEQDIEFLFSEEGMDILSYYFFVNYELDNIRDVFRYLFNKNCTPDLYDYQNEHIRKIINSYKYHPGVCDTSITGSGKTHTTCAIANQENLDILVVCPNNIQKKWKELTWMYSVPCN